MSEHVERIEIVNIASSPEEGWFIVNNEIGIKYDEFGEEFERDGNVSAQVSYDEDKYTVQQIEMLIIDLLEKIIMEYVPEKDENVKKL